jgi:diguanylate cyclase (GGDEF)-like protein
LKRPRFGAVGRFSATVMIALLRSLAPNRAFRRDRDVRARIETMTAQLIALRAILDDLDYGIVVLDHDQRAQFVNRAFRRLWRVSDDLAESRPTFVRLMYHGRGTSAYAVSHHQLGDYVAGQLRLIRSGEVRSLNIRLVNGEVLQFRCKALPDGGRLLTYDNVSELVRHADSLERLATTDAMTGLYNRRRFLAVAESEWSRFQRYGRAFAMLMVDIDHFKSVNDRYGHDVGDKVIKAVAAILDGNKRSSDVVGRLGGEEFALLLPEATLDGACLAAERLRRLVAERMVVAGEAQVPITISVGASVAHAEANGIDALLKEADVALYQAKRSGRNRVCRHGE